MPKRLPEVPFGMKWCSACQSAKTIDCFNCDNKAKDGLCYHCRDCQRRTNSQRWKEKSGEMKAKTAAWIEKNRDRHRATKALWERNNPEKVQAARQRFKEKHPGYRADYFKEYDARPENKQRKAARTARWAKEHTFRRRENERRRTARKRNTQTEKVDYEFVKIRDHRTCFWCGQTNLTDDNMHFDHVHPLSKGGTHTYDNIRVSCAFCNLSKGDKMPEDFSLTHGGVTL